MSTAIAERPSAGSIIESVIAKGDLKNLSAEEKTRYYVEVCRSIGLNPMTKPFEYITLNGRLTLYALRGATDQLRAIHDVSVDELSETERDGVYTVTAKVRNKAGRTDMAKGAVSTKGLMGEALANAMMKAETKAKRRATLSICGLGFLDESEVDNIPTTRIGEPPPGGVARHQPVDHTHERGQVRSAASMWVTGQIARLRKIEDADEWEREIVKVFGEVGTMDDLQELRAYIAKRLINAPKERKDPVFEAGRQARIRIEAPPPPPPQYHATLFDQFNAPQGEFSNREAFADAFMTMYRAVPSIEGREDMCGYNAENIDDDLERRIDEEPEPNETAQRMLDNYDRGRESEETPPAEDRLPLAGDEYPTPDDPDYPRVAAGQRSILTHEAVMPPMRNGEAVWGPTWLANLREEISAVPEFELEEWIEAQRPVLTAAHAAGVIQTALSVIAPCFANASIKLPRWLLDLSAPPRTGADDKEQWLVEQRAKLAQIHSLDAYIAHIRTPDVKNTMNELEKSDRALFKRATALFAERRAEIEPRWEER